MQEGQHFLHHCYLLPLQHLPNLVLRGTYGIMASMKDGEPECNVNPWEPQGSRGIRCSNCSKILAIIITQ